MGLVLGRRPATILALSAATSALMVAWQVVFGNFGAGGLILILVALIGLRWGFGWALLAALAPVFVWDCVIIDTRSAPADRYLWLGLALSALLALLVSAHSPDATVRKRVRRYRRRRYAAAASEMESGLWDAQAQIELAKFIRNHLATSSPPQGSVIAEDLDWWAARLLASGQAHLAVLGVSGKVPREGPASRRAEIQAASDISQQSSGLPEA